MRYKKSNKQSLPFANAKRRMRFYYDKEADVVYFSKGKPSKQDSSREIGEDVVMRFNPKTEQITGLTILNFSKRTSGKSVSYDLPLDVEMRPLI